MLQLICVVFALLLSTIVLGYVVFLQPPAEPRNIPAVPFWISLLALWKDVDQEVIFKQHIRESLLKHGAVKIFFASQWNVLVQRPALVAQIFKEEDDFQKSGNHKKIPGSVLASYLGENIISSHGNIWKRFRVIMQPGLQERWTIDTMFVNANVLGRNLEAAQAAQKSVSIREHMQRYTIANLSEIILGVDFGTMHSDSTEISNIQSSIKRQIFKPIFMSFPFLDTLGIPQREEARRAAKTFTDFIVKSVKEVCYGRPSMPSKDSSRGVDMNLENGSLSRSLLYAFESGKISELQFRNNLTITFVAGQENPELALVSTLYLLAKSPQQQEILKEEFAAVDTLSPSADALQSLPHLSATVLESLRLLPPIGQLINRRAAKDLFLGDDQEIFIPEGTYLGYNCYATNRDPTSWGSDADDFRPERWGMSTEAIQKEYRRRKARAEFISFHGGRRACLGEKFALLQIKVTLFILIRKFRWQLDPQWPDRMTPAGPLSPRGLRLIFHPRDG